MGEGAKKFKNYRNPRHKTSIVLHYLLGDVNRRCRMNVQFSTKIKNLMSIPDEIADFSLYLVRGSPEKVESLIKEP